MYTIYFFRDTRDGYRKGYVGVTKNVKQRVRQHWYDKGDYRRCHWFQKLKREDAWPELHMCQAGISENDVDNAEIQWIANFKAMGWDLVNTSPGGLVCKGVSEETKKKISKSKTGQKLSKEARKRMSQAQKKRIRKPFTKEHRKNLSIAQSKRKRRPAQKKLKRKFLKVIKVRSCLKKLVRK